MFGFVLLPPDLVSTLQRAAVDDTNSSADAEKLDTGIGFQFMDQRQHLFDGLNEGSAFGYLRPDVHLYASNLDVRERFRTLIDFWDAIDSNPEFVLRFARTDVFMGICRDVRIDADGNRCALIQRLGDLVNGAQFLFRFDIETEHLAS